MKKRNLIVSTLLCAATVLATPAVVPSGVVYAAEREVNAEVSEEETNTEETDDEEINDEMEVPEAEENAPEADDEMGRPEAEENAPEAGNEMERPEVEENAPEADDEMGRPEVEENAPEADDEMGRPEKDENAPEPEGEMGRPEKDENAPEKDEEIKAPGKDEEFKATVEEKEEETTTPEEDIENEGETTELGEVTGLKVKAAFKNKIALKWNKVENADGYIVYRRSSESEEWEAIKKTKKTTFKDTRLDAGATYEYYVTAYANDGTESAEGEVIEAATKPAKPSLKVKKTKKNSVKLTWDKTMDADKVVVYMKTGNGKFKKIAVKDASAGSLTKKLKAGKNYSFRIVAYTEAGDEEVYSSYSVTRKVNIRK